MHTVQLYEHRSVHAVVHSLPRRGWEECLNGSGTVKDVLVDCHGWEECEVSVLSGNRVSDVYAPVVVGSFSGIKGASFGVAAYPGDARWRVTLQAGSDDMYFALLALPGQRGACGDCGCNGSLTVRVDAGSGVPYHSTADCSDSECEQLSGVGRGAGEGHFARGQREREYGEGAPVRRGANCNDGCSSAAVLTPFKFRL